MDVNKVVDEIVDSAADAAAKTKAFLATDEGRELRERVASVVILAAPFVAELPILKRTRMGRLLRIAAVGTLLVKGAEWLRDWEPDVPERRS